MDPNAKPQGPGEVILVDKPLTWTSFDVVKKLRHHLKIRKIGHAGTLDPLATGLLILCTGRMTKQIDAFQSQEKEYTGTFTIGATTPSYDLETSTENNKDYSGIEDDKIIETAGRLTGVVNQVPPMFSAIKVGGKRAYKSAREGEQVKMKSRQVTVKLFEVTEIALPKVSFRIVCSKGTYIRSIARDFGDLLEVGAYLSQLRRTRIGNFSVTEALSIEELTKK